MGELIEFPVTSYKPLTPEERTAALPGILHALQHGSDSYFNGILEKMDAQGEVTNISS